MTKENLIPKTETVYEIKDEKEYRVPPFEEFMKNYEGDKQIENSYNGEIKSYGDIRVGKGYGLGFLEQDRQEENCWKAINKKKEEKDRKGICLKTTCWKSRKYGDDEFCQEHREEYEDGIRFTKWIDKTALGIGVGTLLGPAGSIIVGGSSWLANKTVEKITGEKNEIMDAVGDFGGSLAIGELCGLATGAVTGKIAEKAGSSVSNAHKATQAGFTYGQPIGEVTAHEFHKAKGINYDPDCFVCN